MMNYGKHQIFIGGEKQDVIGFISAFLDKIENVEGYQIRIMMTLSAQTKNKSKKLCVPENYEHNCPFIKRL